MVTNLIKKMMSICMYKLHPNPISQSYNSQLHHETLVVFSLPLVCEILFGHRSIFYAIVPDPGLFQG